MAHDWLRLKANCKFQIVEDVFRNRVPDLLQVSSDPQATVVRVCRTLRERVGSSRSSRMDLCATH